MKIRIALCMSGGLFALESYSQSPLPSAVYENGMRSNLNGSEQTPIGSVPRSGADDRIAIYPNPTTNLLWMQVAPTTIRIYRVTFFDSNERILSQQEYSVSAGDQKIRLTLPGSNAGMDIYVKVEEAGKSVPRVERILRWF